MASFTFKTVATGSVKFGEYRVGKTAADTLQLKLYTNNITPTVNTVVGDLTECADGGYSAYALTPASWTVAWDTDHSGATFTVDNTITFAASASIYGAYLTNADGTVLMGIADFSGVKNFDASDEFTFTECLLNDTPDWS